MNILIIVVVVVVLILLARPLQATGPDAPGCRPSCAR